MEGHAPVRAGEIRRARMARDLESRGIKDRRVLKIGAIAPHEAARSIDAGGLIVSPGFIDMHTHSDATLLQDGEAHSKIRQGVTLDIIGESQSVSPVSGHVAEEYRHENMHRFEIEVDWEDFDGYFDRVRRQGISMNVASSVSPQQIKRAVVSLGSSLGIRTTAEGVETREQLESVTAEGCSEFQGFLFSHPRSAADIVVILEQAQQTAPVSGVPVTPVHG